MSSDSSSVSYFEVDAIKELLDRGGLGLPGLPPPPRLLGLGLLFIQDVHINELESADFTVEHPHPRPHRRLTDDVNDVSALQHKASGAFLSVSAQLYTTVRITGWTGRQYLQFEGVGVIWTGGEVGMN